MHRQFTRNKYVYLSRHSINPDFKRYLSAQKELVQKLPVLPEFLASNPRPIEIPVDKKIRGLKIELPTTECLHLHSITLLDANGRVIPFIADSKISLSSSYGETMDRVNSGQLFNPKNDFLWSIHTNREPSPWVIIMLPKPALVKTVVINNRPDHHAKRAAGLTVSTTDNGHSWRKIWTVGGTDEIKKTRELMVKYKIDSLPSAEIIREFTVRILYGDYHAAQLFYKHIPAIQQRALREAVNELVLYDQELEWTSHGAYRSFRFWDNAEKSAYIHVASGIVKDLRSLSPDVCFGFGSVLAVVRDRDMIPHDDDMDIIIGFRPEQAATLHEAIRLVKAHLKPKGYTFVGDFFSHCQVKRKDVKKVDVFVGIYDKDGTIGWYPGTRSALKRADIFPSQNASLLGVPCAIPQNSEKYLETVYGKSWLTPEPGWSHAWDSASYRDIA